VDYSRLYDLENYVFTEVNSAFHRNGQLNASEFFCIIIWKANRSKSKIASLLTRSPSLTRESLEQAVESLTRGLYSLPDGKHRLRYPMRDWGFRLPMATAILSTLYPDEFTVYDSRVCDMVSFGHDFVHKTNPDSVWSGYQELKSRVCDHTPMCASLRHKDRYLWGKSFWQDLQEDLNEGFVKSTKQ